MKINEYIPAFEAVLFASGESVDIGRICDVFEVEKPFAERIMRLLSERLDDENSGIKLIKLENSYQLVSREKYIAYIRNLLDLRRKQPLSSAALEVLSVVAYNQPVTKSFIEDVRGVDCSGVVTTLVEKDLLEEKGRFDGPGRPILYGTTDNFLRCFSLSSLSDLPSLPELEDNPDTQQKLEIKEN